MRTLICAALLAGFATSALAANFSGKWAIQNPPGRMGRGGGPTILTLNHAGNEVTGTIGQRADMGSSGSPVGNEIMFGKVEGDTLTFYVWVGGDEPVKQFYKGTMSGDEITFTVTGGRATGFGPQSNQPPAPQQLTAKRTK